MYASAMVFRSVSKQNSVPWGALRAEFNNGLSANSIVRQTFDKLRVNEVTHQEVMQVNVRLDDTGWKFLPLVGMSRKLRFVQCQHL